MKVYGLSESTVINTLESIGLELINGKTVGKVVQGRIAPKSSKSEYARHTPSGRAVRACCYHGFRDGILALFNAGATKVQSTVGSDIRENNKATWESAKAFRIDLMDLFNMETSSMGERNSFGNLCECETPSMNYILGRVNERFDPEALAILF